MRVIHITENTKDVLMELVRTSFKLRYNNSILGFIWVILKPFLTFLIMYLVWTSFAGSTDYYPVKLMLGIVLYTFLNEGIIFGMNGLLDKAGIILKVNFNRIIAVIASTIMALINLFINLILFTIIFIIYLTLRGDFPSSVERTITNPLGFLGGIGFFLIIVLVLYLVILGASFILSIVIVKVRDLQHIMELLFQIGFWATPIFYSIEQLSSSGIVATLLRLNPLGILITSSRKVLIYGQYENIGFVLTSLAIGILFAYFGYKFFKIKVKKVAEYF